MVIRFNFLLLLFLVGCSSINRNVHKAYVESLNEGDFTKALTIAKSDKFYPNVESRLLKVLEISLLNFYNKNYYQALLGFDEAKEISDKLYTVSISKKVTKALVNDNSDNYYGKRYERSLIRFYQSLCHFTLFMTGSYEQYEKEVVEGKKKIKQLVPEKKLSESEQRFHHMAARSILIEWNSLLESYKSELTGEITFKDDLLAKIYGAIIHESFQTSADNQIAKKLYEAAKDLVFKYYNLYPTYNTSYEKFKNDFKKLHKLKRNKIEEDYVSKTQVHDNLIKFIDQRLANLKNKKHDNVILLYQKGIIQPKSVNKVEFPIPLLTLPVGDNQKDDFLKFSVTTMGLARNTKPVIYFETPQINALPVSGGDIVIIENQEKKKVFEKELSVLNPLGDMAKLEIEDELAAIKLRTGTRVATKHLSALASAYFLYKKSLGNGELIAYALSAGSYAIANKSISESERADIRQWNALPSSFQIDSLSLPEGNYSIYISGQENFKKAFVVEKKDSAQIIFMK